MLDKQNSPLPCSSLFPASASPQSSILSSPKAGRIAPSSPEPAALHCPFKALVGQHQGLSRQHCPAAVGTPSHGHFPGPLLFVEEFQCFADSKKIKRREDRVFPSLRTKDLVLYLRIFVFCDVSEKYTPAFSVIVCLFLTAMGLSPHVLLCSLETSHNKDTAFDTLLWKKIKLFFSEIFF